MSPLRDFGVLVLVSPMLQNVDQTFEGIADVEARHAPGLGHRTIFDLEPRGLHPPMNPGEVVHLDGKMGDRGSGPAFSRYADLWCNTAVRGESCDPSK